MKISFEKWHGCKNDFLVFHVDERQAETIQSLRRSAASLCSRDGSGVGGDGVLVISLDPRAPQSNPKLRIFNSDGSEASTCGNGIRVAALSELRRREQEPHCPAPEDFSVEFSLTTNALVSCRFWPVTANQILVGVDMGEVETGEELSWFESAKQVVRLLTDRTKGSLELESWLAVETQNPHLVLFGNFGKNFDFAAAGKWLQTAPGWPEGWTGVNVHFVASESESTDQAKSFKKLPLKIGQEAFKVFVYERGAGPTQACGSGAVAVAEFLHHHLHLTRKELITVAMPGGNLYARVDAETRHGELVGPGTFVFAGEVEV